MPYFGDPRLDPKNTAAAGTWQSAQTTDSSNEWARDDSAPLQELLAAAHLKTEIPPGTALLVVDLGGDKRTPRIGGMCHGIIWNDGQNEREKRTGVDPPCTDTDSGVHTYVVVEARISDWRSFNEIWDNRHKEVQRLEITNKFVAGVILSSGNVLANQSAPDQGAVRVLASRKLDSSGSKTKDVGGSIVLPGTHAARMFTANVHLVGLNVQYDGYESHTELMTHIQSFELGPRIFGWSHAAEPAQPWSEVAVDQPAIKQQAADQAFTQMELSRAELIGFSKAQQQIPATMVHAQQTIFAPVPAYPLSHLDTVQVPKSELRARLTTPRQSLPEELVEASDSVTSARFAQSKSKQLQSLPVADSCRVVPIAPGSLRAHLTDMDHGAQWAGHVIGRMPTPMLHTTGFDERVRHDTWSSPFANGGGRVLRVPEDFPTVDAAVAAAGPMDRVQTHQVQHQHQPYRYDAGQRTISDGQTKSDKHHRYDAEQWKW